MGAFGSVVDQAAIAGGKKAERNLARKSEPGKPPNSTCASPVVAGRKMSSTFRRRLVCVAPKGADDVVGAQLPEGMISMDYGHYTPAGSNYAVKTILAPVLDPVLAAAQARKAN